MFFYIKPCPLRPLDELHYIGVQLQPVDCSVAAQFTFAALLKILDVSVTAKLSEVHSKISSPQQLYGQKLTTDKELEQGCTAPVLESQCPAQFGGCPTQIHPLNLAINRLV